MHLKNNVAKYLFITSIIITLIGGTYLYGVYSYKNQLFPIPTLSSIKYRLNELLNPSDSILAVNIKHSGKVVEIIDQKNVMPGLIMIVGSIDGGRNTFVRIISRNGKLIHEWTPRWTEIWGDNQWKKFKPKHFPIGDNGMFIHGIELLPDGSFVANFQSLSTFRMDICGDVMWKLDNYGHHSVDYSNNGYLLVAAHEDISQGEETSYSNFHSSHNNEIIQKISLDGEILEEISLLDVLAKNDLFGLMFLSASDNYPYVELPVDAMHNNNVEVFPETMESDIFEPGDILVSPRNINAVLVFDPDSLEVKFFSIGRFVRQHDPDFISGDRISLLDNRNFDMSRINEENGSRIIEIDVINSTQKVVLDGKGKFFTSIQGDHQRLSNGNILVTSSREGQISEFSPEGDVVWKYNNIISETQNGRIYTGKLLPEHMDVVFFKNISSKCDD